MGKDFDKWNELKKKINKETDSLNNIYWREREIWFCSIGVNIGSELDGKNDFFERPVLILKKVSSTTFLAVPLTSKRKEGSWYVPLRSADSSAIISQIRLVDCSRLNRRIRLLDDSEYEFVRNQLKDYL